jgi:hypothetical protein
MEPVLVVVALVLKAQLIPLQVAAVQELLLFVTTFQ